MSKELDLWKGEFGDQYRERNIIQEDLLNARTQHWISCLQAVAVFGSLKRLPNSIFEIGCGAGINLLAINKVYELNGEMCKYYALEPNQETLELARKNCLDKMFKFEKVEGEAQKIELNNNISELVFTSGVLIHIHPDNQLDALREIHRVSSKYIICMEYFSPDLREIDYHEQRALWTRDYGSLWMDNFNLRCLAVFFSWKRTSKLDNITTWIFEKVN